MQEKRPSTHIGYAAVILSAVALFALPLFLRKDTENITYTRMLMGTVVQVTLMEGDRSGYDRAADRAFEEIKRLEGLFSSYKPDSDVSRISAAAGSGPVEVSKEVIDVLDKSLEVCEMSGGAFDPTVGALARVWGYSAEKERVPSKEDLERLLPLVGYKGITVDRKNSRAGLDKKGMTLNLGGIAKGYIMEKAAGVLKKEGIRRAIVHAGGDMVMFDLSNGKPFIIGIQHPREKRLLGTAQTKGGAVSTSGDYERFFIKDGIRYHHILDPKTGFPAADTRSVTIISQDPVLADGLSTAVFVMGPEKGMGLIERLRGVEGVIVDSAGRVKTSSGFKGRIF